VPFGTKTFILYRFSSIIRTANAINTIRLQRSKHMRKFLSFLGGTLMGALVGATVALLLTPSSGETLRAQIRDRFAALQDELTDAANERKVELEKYLETLRQQKSGVQLEK